MTTKKNDGDVKDEAVSGGAVLGISESVFVEEISAGVSIPCYGVTDEVLISVSVPGVEMDSIGVFLPVCAHLGSALETQIHKPKDHVEDNPHHPLDPLTMQEVNNVRTIISTSPPFCLLFQLFTPYPLMNEPHKDLVLDWKEGDPLPPRKALVIAPLNGQSHVLSVDFDLGLVTSNEINHGSGYPMLTMDDISVAMQVALSYK
ncbi:unnamed protein product [Dovyalis caffra]|uniref:Copper amine oxidase N2-terminal domain-containing protein n=1 Tax=Dovyalis caffra TaxID=77055 RepID=A0AAV1SP37_9ROSI|nr:unnamed protein product [Dovyalis caffra]